MGVRLYPNTLDTAKLEMLAHVPAGTAERLAAVKARHAAENAGIPARDRYDSDYRQWCEINDDDHLGDYSNFLVFGWGKFDPAGVATGYSGELTDPNQIAILFHCNDIAADPSLCDGVHWC